jgi:hypothetical protein
MRTIIAGSRDGVTYADVFAAMEACGWTPTAVLSGNAHGVDKMGEFWAKERGVLLERYPAKWKDFGKAAGHVRNKEMAQRADALVAVWDGQSPGTKDMLEQAARFGLKVYLHRVEQQESPQERPQQSPQESTL